MAEVIALLAKSCWCRSSLLWIASTIVALIYRTGQATSPYQTTCSAGQYRIKTCSNCVGSARRRASIDCTACPSGRVDSNADDCAVSCALYTCPSGHSGPKNPTSTTYTQANCCQECGAGTYQGSTGQASCQACDGSVRRRRAATSCTACDPGYYTGSNDDCEAYACTTTASGNGCASCVSQASRTSDTTCSGCNGGHYPSAGTCQAYMCVTGVGSLCVTCVAQASRNSHSHCATCNLGHHLSSESCQACGAGTYQDSIGSQTSCKTCSGSVRRRTSAISCTSCSAGYYDTSGDDCTAYGCNSGASGSTCFSCKSQSTRTNDDSCASCHSSYYVGASDTCVFR